MNTDLAADIQIIMNEPKRRVMSIASRQQKNNQFQRSETNQKKSDITPLNQPLFTYALQTFLVPLRTFLKIKKWSLPH